MNRFSSLMTAATADKAMAWLVTGAVLLVIIMLARAIGRLSKLARIAATPAPAPKPSGGQGRLLAGLAAAGGGLWYWDTHRAAAVPAKAAPAPASSPSPVPTVTRTVAPHLAPVHFHLPVSGGDVVIIFVIAAVVAIVLLGPVLRRSS